MHTETPAAGQANPRVTPNLHPAYRPDIDGLRAVAVLAVVLFHAFPAYLRGGFIGVDVFFVISGYLITSILLKSLDVGSFSIVQFYGRRVRRIFPALLLVLGAVLAFGWVSLFADEYRQLGKHVIGGGAFVSNILFWREVGYFDTAAETKPLLHLWSLGIEEQFYIFWPLLLAFIWKRRWPLVIATGVLAALSFGVNVGFIDRFAAATFYSPASRAWELLIGAALACHQARSLPLKNGALPQLLATVGAALLALGFVLVTRERAFPGWYALLPVLGAASVIAAGPGAWFNRFVLANPLLVGVGLISYPLYLWHWPLLSFAQIVESGLPSPKIRAALVGTAFVLAWLTWLLIERPVRRSRHPHTVKALCALMVLMIGAALVPYRTGGLPQRAAVVDSAANQKALVMVEDVANANACKARYGFDTMYKYCLLSKVDQAPTVALVGDSHGYHVSAGLKRYYDSIGENLLFLGTRHPYFDVPTDPNDGYQKATPAMLQLVLDTDSIKTVIFSTHVRFTEGNEDTRAIINGARKTIGLMLAKGKHVIFMNDVPVMDFDPRACLKRAGVSSSATRSPCAIPRAEMEKQFAEHNAIVANIRREFPSIGYFDPNPLFCDADWCHAMIGGRLMYRDHDHLSFDGDLMVGRRFAEWAKAPRMP